MLWGLYGSEGLTSARDGLEEAEGNRRCGGGSQQQQASCSSRASQERSIAKPERRQGLQDTLVYVGAVVGANRPSWTILKSGLGVARCVALPTQ